MAALIERAAARAESRLRRGDGTALRLSAERRRRGLEDAMVEARHLCARLETRRRAGLPSPWSSLLWEQPGHLLDDVLTAL